ncbi:glycosyltransferase [Schleiferiaceae bacterium]|nr:glycosyltransferase [Schleiferiaceae bacterium]
MKLVFYSIVLNHHQVFVADELHKLLGDDFVFVETTQCYDSKGSTEDYSTRPYLIRSWNSEGGYEKAMSLALNADVCVFSGCEALDFERARLKKGLLSFDMGERLLKRGWLNLISPRILKLVMSYHLGGWSNKPVYKLCCGAFVAKDNFKLKMFVGKGYKWGYFTKVDSISDEKIGSDFSEKPTLIWGSRFLKWKHPELPVKLARKLKEKGLSFHLIIAGDGELYQMTKSLISKLDVGDNVSLIGNVPNKEILALMQSSQVFIFTSDQNEGWGAVANESMSNGCVLVASDSIGSTPYLVKEGITGFSFENGNIESLVEKVEWLIEHPQEMHIMQRNAYQQMKNNWNPRLAAANLLTLINDIQNGRQTSIKEGPCSNA